MSLDDWINRLMPEISNGLDTCWNCPLGANKAKGFNLAGKQAVHGVLDNLVSILFPGCHGFGPASEAEFRVTMRERLKEAAIGLRDQVERAYRYQCEFDQCKQCGDCGRQAEEAVEALVRALPEIQRVLQQDIVAAYEGDPAAKSTMEIVMSYPGLYAIVVHRIAHLLYAQKVPLIPRIMSEHAHSATGIDIHPGATIGEGFFIDHGTGVVIGETCEIGRRVKLYQGVTLGALSFEKDAHGRLVKGTKRHPNVEDNVVIYAGATILGGKTTIGAGSEIGGNVWLTHSVPPGSKVRNQEPKPLIRPAGERRDPGAGDGDGI